MSRQKLGQHFLVRPDVVERIVAAAEIKPGETVIEIGPGRGALTQGLLSAGARVFAVELDRRLHEKLAGRFRGLVENGRLTLRQADFLKLDSGECPGPVKFAANLPYAAASPMLQRILNWPGWSAAVLMFQKEVAERLLAEPGGRKYGLLGISAAIKAKILPVCDVPRDCFSPPPRVDSAVVRLDPLPSSSLPAGLSEEKFFAVAGAAFAHRRKTLANSLSRAMDRPRAEVVEALSRAGLPASIRAEQVPLESFISLAQLLG